MGAMLTCQYYTKLCCCLVGRYFKVNYAILGKKLKYPIISVLTLHCSPRVASVSLLLSMYIALLFISNRFESL